MVEGTIYFKGTIIELINPLSHSSDIEKYMLIENREAGYVFQLVCISGYYAGTSFGMVKEDPKLNQEYDGVSKQHLITEIERNFGEISKDALKIYSA